MVVLLVSLWGSIIVDGMIDFVDRLLIICFVDVKCCIVMFECVIVFI